MSECIAAWGFCLDLFSRKFELSERNRVALFRLLCCPQVDRSNEVHPRPVQYEYSTGPLLKEARAIWLALRK